MTYSENEWHWHPIDDSQSGEAFMGTRRDEKVFLKRNSSPFIAALSAHGIAPKLIWSQRTYSGDILTAQEWKNGRLLRAEDMSSQAVIDLIKEVHQSQELLQLLKRVGGQTYRPLEFIEDYYHQLPNNLMTNQFFTDIINHLEDLVCEDFYRADLCVCHGDLHHNNFLVDEDTHQLYLVDWENVRIADPLSDMTDLLIRYLPPSRWMDWFARYRYDVQAPDFYDRVRWYSLINCLYQIKQYHQEGQNHKMNQMILLVKQIYEH